MTLHELPSEDVRRANIKKYTTFLQLTSSSSWYHRNPDPVEPIFSCDAISLTNPPIDWFMKNIEASDNTSNLLSSLSHGSAIAVSDGSFFPEEQVGSCAWIIATSDGKEWIRGGGIIPGPPDVKCRH